MASTTLQTTWVRPSLIIFSEKKPQPIDESSGIWDLGGDDRELTIVGKQRKNNIVTLKIDQAHLLSVGDEVVIDGLGDEWDGTFTITNSRPNGLEVAIQYSQIGVDSGDEFFLTATGYQRKDNYALIEFAEPHLFYKNDIVSLSINGTAQEGYGERDAELNLLEWDDSAFVNKQYTVVDHKPDDNPNRIKLYIPGADSGDYEKSDIKAMKRENDVVTLKFYENHPYQIGDIIEITRLGSDWNGVFEIISASSNINANEITYRQEGDDTSAFTNGDFYGTQNGKKVIRKKREDNQVTLEFEEPHGLSIGTPIVVEGLGEAFDRSASPYFIVSESSISGDNKKLRYNHVGPATLSTTEYSINAIKREDNKTTIQFATSHEFVIGDKVIVSGVSVTNQPSASSFNKTYKILDNAPAGRKNRIRVIDEGPDFVNNNPPTLWADHQPEFYTVLAGAKAVQTDGGWRDDAGVVKGIYNKFVLAPQWIQTTNINKTEYNVAFVERTSNEVTVELGSNHDYRVGDQITFYGSSVTWGAFNGTFIISSTPSANLIKYTDEGTNLARTASSTFIYPAKTTRVGTLRNPFTNRKRGGGIHPLDPNNVNTVTRIRGGGFAPDSGTLKITGQDFYYLTDDNRSDLSIGIERIEYKKRMINGRMRSYYVADKKSFNVSWRDLETSNTAVSEYLRTLTPQPKRLAAAKEMVQWYNEHKGSFYLTLIYDGPDTNSNVNVRHRLEYYEVFFDNFNYTVKYRGQNLDVWDISMTLVEA